MSEEQAKEFIEKLKTDAKLSARLLAFIKKEGFSCTLEELGKVNWDELIALQNSGSAGGSSSLPASEHWG